MDAVGRFNPMLAVRHGTRCRQLFKTVGSGLLVMLMVVWTGGVASAGARAPTLVLHPRFRLVASGASSFASDGRYVLVSSPRGSLVIDDRTARRTTLRPPPLCGFTYVVGGGLVLTSCAGHGRPPFQVYSIAAGTWSPVQSPGGTPVALGTHWIEYYGPAELGCVEHCSYRYSFGDITTGQVRTLPAWTPGATTVPALNSPRLPGRLCSPLRVPQGFPTGLTTSAFAPSPLKFSGPFAAGLEWYLRGGLSEVRLVLEHCGSRSRRVLTNQITDSPSSQFAVSRRALVWLNFRGGPVQGLFLPSQKRFMIKVPPLKGDTGAGRSIFLTERQIYLETALGQVFAATSPSLACRSKCRS